MKHLPLYPLLLGLTVLVTRRGAAQTSVSLPPDSSWQALHGSGFTISLPSSWRPAAGSFLFGKSNRWTGPEGAITWTAGPFGERLNPEDEPRIYDATFGSDFGGPRFEREIIGGREAHVIRGQGSKILTTYVEWRGLQLRANAKKLEQMPLIWVILQSVRFPESPAQPGQGRLPASWYAGGPACAAKPSLRVHAYTDDFYILRQPACTNYEKPFLYLLLGRDRALLLDTGAGGLDVATTVDSLLEVWRRRSGGRPVELVVAHSHSHGDHVAGDSQFVGRAGVTVVGLGADDVSTFFGIRNWPEETVTFDLGGRILEVLPIPGHQVASLAFYDRRTGVLLSGDTFYPGRLYVRDTAAYVRSIERLVRFTRTRPVAHILGTHIENTNRPGEDYPVGTVDQPEEHALQLTRADLVALDSALAGMRGRLSRTVMPHFTIWPVVPR